jgi:hypothetical protein
MVVETEVCTWIRCVSTSTHVETGRLGEPARPGDGAGKRYEDWRLEDPAGKGVDAVRPIRDEIKNRIEALLAELIPHRQ